MTGSELQRLALILTFAKKVDIYLIDESSAFMDSEWRIIFAKLIKDYV